jgi:rare lipoprotein A
LPLPSIVKVTNLNNGKELLVRVNDRGPFHSTRIIDVSKAAAAELGMLGAGTAKVKVELQQEATLNDLKTAANRRTGNKQQASN